MRTEPTLPLRTAIFTLCVSVLLLGVGGCAGVVAAPGAGRPYPELMPRTEPLNIQVFRESTRLTLTNTTATSYGEGWIWLNAWYGRPIDGLRIGERLSLPLTTFEDEFGESFRAGGFFAAERPDTVVLAELEVEETDENGNTDRVLKPLIVVAVE